MNEELERYNDELGMVEKAILQVEGMIRTKEENVQDLQSQLDELAAKRKKIERTIEEKEKAQENEKNAKTEMKRKDDEPEVEPEELAKPEEIEELYDKPNASGLRVEKLNKGLMETMVGANKARNASLLKEMQAQAKSRAEAMPELGDEPISIESKETKETKINEADDLEK